MPLAGRLADGEDQPDRLRPEPAGDEGQRLRRGAVEPLRVVHDRDQRPLLGHVGQQAQDGQTDQEAIRGVAVAQPEGRAERVALRAGQALQAIHERRAQLLEAGERELHLGLDARRPGEGAPGRAPREVLEQRALADAGLAAQHERPARTRPHARHQLIERRALAAPAEQPRRGRRHGHGRGYGRAHALATGDRGPPGSPPPDDRPLRPTEDPAGSSRVGVRRALARALVP